MVAGLFFRPRIAETRPSPQIRPRDGRNKAGSTNLPSPAGTVPGPQPGPRRRNPQEAAEPDLFYRRPAPTPQKPGPGQQGPSCAHPGIRDLTGGRRGIHGSPTDLGAATGRPLSPRGTKAPGKKKKDACPQEGVSVLTGLLPRTPSNDGQGGNMYRNDRLRRRHKPWFADIP